MIHNRSFVPMNPDKKEINELEHSPFDFIANEGNIHSYAASLIPSHWHRELEIFILLEGRVRIGAGSETFEVVPGEGCFINTGILHSFACLVPSPCRYRSFVFDAGIVSGTPGSIFDTRYIRPLLENGPAYLKFEHLPNIRHFSGILTRPFLPVQMKRQAMSLRSAPLFPGCCSSSASSRKCFPTADLPPFRTPGSNSCCPGSTPISSVTFPSKKSLLSSTSVPVSASGFSVSIFIVRPWNIFRRNGCSWQPKSLFPLIFP